MEGDRGGRRLCVHPRSRGHHEDPGGREEVQRRDGLQRGMVSPREAEPAPGCEARLGIRDGAPCALLWLRPPGVAGDGPRGKLRGRPADRANRPKDLLGYLDIGLNPNARSGFLQDAIVAGNVYVAVGANDEVPGGKNKTDFYLGGSLTGANVTIDGREVVRNVFFNDTAPTE